MTVRALDLDVVRLRVGAHDENTDGEMCVMEAVAYIAGEPWSDHPQCASPVIAAFLHAWNDGLNDDDRQALKQYVPRLIGTRTDEETESRLAWMATDWLVRVHTPAWLRLAGLTGHADALAGLPELTAGSQVPSIKPAIEAAQKDAAAARAAAWGAALAAAWDAALAAAWDAARDAARAAARDAAWDAAWGAALAAARAAALAAARDALAPTVTELQASAHDLVDRMLTLANSHP
jgi:hypothetical protein